MGLIETDGGHSARVATDLGEVACACSGGLPNRAYVVVSADVRKGSSAQGAYVSVKNGKVLRVLGPSESLADVVPADKKAAA